MQIKRSRVDVLCLILGLFRAIVFQPQLSSASALRSPVAAAAFASTPPPPPSDLLTSKLSELRKNVVDGALLKNPFGRGQVGGDENESDEEPSFDLTGLKSSTEPRRFYVAPSQILNIASASFSFLFRAGSGAFADGYKLSVIERDDSKYSALAIGNYQLMESCSPSAVDKAPVRPLILYEFEACPFCRKVREAVTILSLPVTFRPCPKGGKRFRRRIKKKYGDGATFPFLRDPNTGVEMFESDDIISYLFKVYGDRKVPSTLSKGTVTALTCGLGLLPRLGRGGRSRNSEGSPDLPLILWSYESSPFCKVVKEALCELQLEHTQISCPRGSPNRQKLLDKTGGRFQVPYLEDPNEGVELFESAAIVEYLEKRYGVQDSPVRYL